MDFCDTPQSLLKTLYLDYLQRHDIRSFINQTIKHYCESTLLRLTDSCDVETRRAAALTLGFIGTYQANDALGLLLKDKDRSVRLLAESSLKSVWSREGTEEQRQELYCIMRHIASQNYDEAIHRANILLEEYPLYTEARNQRAIALFATKQFDDAIEDSRIVLDLNPFHFGAAVGMGHAYLQLRDTYRAIECFQQALFINPNLEQIRRHVERLLLKPL